MGLLFGFKFGPATFCIVLHRFAQNNVEGCRTIQNDVQSMQCILHVKLSSDRILIQLTLS